MFGLLKKLNPVNKVAPSNFNNAFAVINEAKKATIIQMETKQDNYSVLLSNAKSLMVSFIDSGNTDSLKEAAAIFMDLTQMKSNEAEPYFYLAYIFNLMNEKSFALEYIKIVNVINPDFKGLEELKNSVLGQKKEVKVETQKVISLSSPRIVLSIIKLTT